MHLVLTGATGLVGSAVLHHMLNAPSIHKVTILSRRPVAQATGHEKVNVIIHRDFANYASSVLDQVKDADGVVWAQGISQTKVSKEAYEEITYTYPLAFARALAETTSPKPLNFVYVSGEGATTTPSSLTPRFGIVKGRAEKDLLALSKDPEHQNLRPYSLRPAGVDPGHHQEIHEFLPEKNVLEKVMFGPVLSVLRSVANGFTSPTRELGKVLTDLAAGDGAPIEGTGVVEEGRTVTNLSGNIS
ncbi:Uncharacterized protein BP5553_05157 [Venustampulla echinocandica]|uniref:NAD-dependent epimerase/dehydratase domain-containing protein n=1 Tax=Venustampulla echinocandica TaxID=2656787 RepID=A0A370TQC4_9HELO|nr:Uncharacterized protein BP5553_05157 [Venustampulla echinocandica]RDL37724.1 Uncharacterized protein BP5553_05157 [Venustampulla echinocandica]